MKRSACLIFNPVAGQGDPDQDLAVIRSLLEPEIGLDIRVTTAEVGADVLAREAVERQVDAVIVSGGDGTLSAAAAALVSTSIPLGIISRGTANAFANALDLPTAIDSACQTILGGATKTVDAACCNKQPMVLLAGIGFEAETVERADREAKNRLGFLAYILAGFQQLRNLENFDVELETEDRVIQVSAAAVTVANAAPATSVLAQGPAGIIPDDGLLDITLIAPANKAGAIAATYHLLQTALKGDPTDRNDIGYLRTRWVRISTNPEQKVVVDGELIGTTPIEIECIPAGLTIFAPLVEEEVPIEKLEGLPNLKVEMKDEAEFDSADLAQ
jgi:YegS/Rv2252/BmrU family lipid kinase